MVWNIASLQNGTFSLIKAPSKVKLLAIK